MEEHARDRAGAGLKLVTELAESKQMSVSQWTKMSFHSRLLAEAFPNRVEIRDGMLLIAILHSCEIHLSAPIIDSHPELLWFEPITANHASEALASLWKGIRDPRNSAHFWARQWNFEWSGFERLQSINAEDAARAAQLKAKIEEHPIVRVIVPVDANPFLPSNNTGS
jgi:hypothetical protein